MTIDPAELGYHERRPGSGVWYRPDDKPGQGATTYAPKVCENCGGEFMGTRQHGRARFCSTACRDRSHVRAVVSYGQAHRRVRRALGKASGYPCADCGHQAFEWSQVHGTTGQELGHYQPRCHPCHTAYDAPMRSHGERSPAAKLTEAVVRQILWSPAGPRRLAAMYGVDRALIQRVRRRKVWRHVAYYDWPSLWNAADHDAAA